MKWFISSLICLATLALLADRRGQMMNKQNQVDFNTYSNLSLWLEYSSVILSNNNVITNIYDLSLSNRTISVSGSPIYIASGGGSNNLPFITLTNAARFSGVQQVTFSAAFTAMMVVNFYRTGFSSSYFFGGSGSQPNASYDYAGAYSMYNGNTISGGTVITNRWHLITLIYNGASSKLRTNGTDCFSGNAGSNQGLGQSGDWAVGGVGAIDMNGAFLRAFVWDRVLTVGEYTNIENQCNSDFGLW